MSRVFRRGLAPVSANLTPMIDVTFLLIVFFVLVSQIVEFENVDMQLPRPEDPPTAPLGDEQRAVINVLPGADGAVRGYRVGSVDFAPGDDGLDALVEHLAGLYAASPSLHVNLRADRDTEYGGIAPIMASIARATAEAGVPAARARVNLVVIPER